MLISHTRLRTYSECPWKYRALYLDKLPQEPIPAFEAGKALHRMVADYGEWCHAQKVGEDEAQARVIASTTEDAQVQKQFLYWAGQHTWEFEGILGRTGNLFEQWHEYDLGGDDLFRCRIDLCRWGDREEGELWIVDFKSGGYSHPPEPPEAPIQLKLYALVMARELGKQVDTVHARIDYLGGCMNWAWDLDGFDFDETEEWLRQQVARVKAETEFRAEPGAYCSNCTVRSACSYGYSCEVEQLLTEQIVQELDVLNAKREAYSDALKQRVADFGEHTDLRRRTWGYHEGAQCYTVPDPEKYAAARREAKLKAWAFASWNQSALRRDANREPLAALLEETGRERRWGVKFLEAEDGCVQEPAQEPA